MRTQRRIRRIIFLACPIIVIFGIIYQINLIRQGYWQDDKIVLEEITVCSGIDAETNRVISPEIFLKKDTPEQFVCGRIKSRSNARLWFLFYKEDIEHQTTSEWFEGDVFAHPLYKNAGNPTGLYRVEVRQGRKLLGTLYYAVDDREIKKVRAVYE